MPDLPDKLASAKDGSRELDAEMHCLMTGRIVYRGLPVGYTLVDQGSGPQNSLMARAQYISSNRGPCPHYTTSLDAIVSLIGEKLPANGGIDLFVRKGVSTAVIYHSEDGDGEWKASGKTIELAACRAFLRALQKGNGQ